MVLLGILLGLFTRTNQELSMKRSLIYSDATTTRKLLEIRTSGQLAIARHKRDSSVIYKILNQEDTLIPTRALTGSLEVQIMEECTPTAKS